MNKKLQATMYNRYLQAEKTAMKKKLLNYIILLFSICTFGQSKMIVGQNHTIFVEIPNKWIQVENEQLPFFIKPDEINVSPSTYMYVYGIDYDINPEIEKWVAGNNEYLKSNFPEIIIGTKELTFKNLNDSEYYTGKSKVITYEYPDKRKENILVIECKNSIITVVLSAENSEKLDEYSKALLELGNSIQIMETELKRE